MLNLVFLLLAVLWTVGVYLFGPALSHWWSIPILIGAFFALIVLYLLLLLFSTLFLPKKKPVKKPKGFCQFMIWITMDWLMKLFRIRVKLTGTELLPDEPCLIVSNHRSDFDPMVVLSVMCRRMPAYISKEANFKIPIVGNYIHHAGFLAIDRGNGMRALRTLKQAAEMMQTCGVDVGIYPEGTRSKTGELLRFKSGAFILAKRADAPIVVMTTRGTEAIGKNVLFRSTKVQLKIVRVIDRRTVQETPQEELRDMVQNIVAEELAKSE